MSIAHVSKALDLPPTVNGSDRMVLIVLAEAANQDTDECWPKVETIAARSGLRQARYVTKAIENLAAAGYVEVDPNGCPDSRYAPNRRPNLYRLVGAMAVAAAGGARRAGSVSGATRRSGGARRADLGVRDAPKSARRTSFFEPEVEPEPNPPPADAVETQSRPTVADPIKGHAHRLATLAMEQPVKPVLRSDGNPFAAAMGIFERSLRAGRSVQELERAVVAGIDVWTDAGVQTSVAKTRPGNGHNGRAAGEEAVLENIRRRRQ